MRPFYIRVLFMRAFPRPIIESKKHIKVPPKLRAQLWRQRKCVCPYRLEYVNATQTSQLLV